MFCIRGDDYFLGDRPNPALGVVGNMYSCFSAWRYWFFRIGRYGAAAGAMGFCNGNGFLTYIFEMEITFCRSAFRHAAIIMSFFGKLKYAGIFTHYNRCSLLIRNGRLAW